MAAKKPVFYSLVDTAAVTSDVYEKLVSLIKESFPDKKCEFLGDPLAGWSDVQIGKRRKRDFMPAARLLFRWGLFWDFLDKVVRPAFVRKPDIIIARQFGFDVYSGAHWHNDCGNTSGLHEFLVAYDLKVLEFCPPTYVFTEDVSPATKRDIGRYFSVKGQQMPRYLVPTLTVPEKARAILHMIRYDLKVQEEQSATA